MTENNLGLVEDLLRVYYSLCVSDGDKRTVAETKFTTLKNKVLEKMK